jgi:hypothetical protein
MHQSHTARFRKLVLFLLFITLPAVPAAAGEGEKTVMAQGVSAIQGGNIQGARAAAVSDALRNAVEQGLGTMMEATAIVENDHLLEEIYTHTSGFVSGYEVLREKQAEGGLYRVTVSAVVETAALRSRLVRLGIIKQMMDYPRILILAESRPEEPAAAKAADAALTGYFTDQRFDVAVESGHALNQGSRAAPVPAELAARAHAEIAVAYRLETEPPDFDGIMETAPVSVSARAVVTSTGQVLSSEQAQAFGVGKSGRAALRDGARKAANQAAQALSADIVGWWADYTANGLPYRILLKMPSGDARLLSAFQQRLRSIHGVTRLSERSTGNGEARMRLTFKGRTSELKRRILEAAPGVDITSSHGRYMELSLK